MTNCQTEEDLLQEKDTAAAVLYEEQITAFLGTLKRGSDKSQNKKIDDMLQVLDNASVSTVDLKSTEKLIIVKTNSLKDFETNDAVRLIFVQYQNKIFRSNIVTFNNVAAPTNYDALLQSIFDRKANKLNYSGTIKFYNPYQAAILELNYQQGELIWQGAVRNKSKQKVIQKSNGCTDWYWVTTYSDGNVKQEYLYTTCSCEEEAYRTANYCGGGGSGGSSSGNNPSTSTQPIQYPENPVDNQLFVYINEKGEIIMEKYDSEKQTWEKVGISLSEVVINNNRENYNTEFYMIPNFNAKVKQNFFGIDFIFTYDPASGSWEGVPIEDLKIINELTGKAKCLNDLLDKNGDSFVQNLLASFEGKSEFDIKIVSKDNVFSTETSLEVNGRTLSPNNNVIVIEISTSRTNDNAALEGARVILHEYIHADIFRKLNTLSNASGTLDFKKTYEAYGNQHGTIAGLYLNSMKEALKEFHKSVLTDDYNKYTNYYGEVPSDAFYEALWLGVD